MRFCINNCITHCSAVTTVPLCWEADSAARALRGELPATARTWAGSWFRVPANASVRHYLLLESKILSDKCKVILPDTWECALELLHSAERSQRSQWVRSSLLTGKMLIKATAAA